MNTDFYLERGRDHAVCEDFAAAGVVNGCGYALVSDGCSSSTEVDFGARILVHAAREHLKPALTVGEPFAASAFARATITQAGRVLGCFAALPASTLDATLLLALVRPGERAGHFRAQVCFWGDGAVVVRQNGRVRATLLRFAGNAPAYLSYTLDGPRRWAYLDRGGGGKELQRVVLELSGGVVGREVREEPAADLLAPYREEFALAAGDSLALVSDGITQFFAADNTPIPWETLAPKLVDYKRPTGVFLRRRMNFFERENRASGIRHLDDVSVAAVTLCP